MFKNIVVNLFKGEFLFCVGPGTFWLLQNCIKEPIHIFFSVITVLVF